jgi:hypothetical protein
MTAPIRVNAGVVKESIKSRTDFSTTMDSQMKQAPLYGVVKQSCDAVVAEGAALLAAEAAVNAAVATLANARDLREMAVVKFDNALNLLISDVEKNAQNPGDVTSLALSVLDRQSYPLEIPAGLTVKYDAAKSLIRVNVDLPPGAASCLLEVSTDPSNPASWKRVTGGGARRSIAGYPPGTYWFRACSVRANDESDFTTPVSVIVK